MPSAGGYRRCLYPGEVLLPCGGRPDVLPVAFAPLLHTGPAARCHWKCCCLCCRALRLRVPYSSSSLLGLLFCCSRILLLCTFCAVATLLPSLLPVPGGLFCYWTRAFVWHIKRLYHHARAFTLSLYHMWVSFSAICSFCYLLYTPSHVSLCAVLYGNNGSRLGYLLCGLLGGGWSGRLVALAL